MVSFAEDFDFEWKGVRVTQAGLCFQVLSLAIFVSLCLRFAWTCRRKSDQLTARFSDLRSTKRFRTFLYGTWMEIPIPLPRYTRVLTSRGFFQGCPLPPF